MRIFLAGATGVVGRSLVPLLVAQGHQVTALTRSSAGAAAVGAAGADPVVGDVYDADALSKAVAAAAPEVVMDQLTDLRSGDLAANARLRMVGSRNLVDAATAAGVRRIVAQSLAFAYAPGPAPAGEEAPLDLEAAEPRRTTVLGVAALEEAVREPPEWVVLRYGMLYGPGTWFSPDGARGDAARAGKLVANRNISSFVHVEDAAAAAVEALRWPSGAVNVCDDEPASGREWMPAFCRWVGAPAPSSVDGERDGWARGADNRHAREHLFWTPRYPSWRDGFA